MPFRNRFAPLFPLLFFVGINAQSFKEVDSYQMFPGFFDFYYDDDKDKIYLKVDDLEKEFLYVNSLSSGVGNNDLGLDRGQIGGEQVVFFKKAGNKLLLIQPNMTYRAITNNSLERQSVEQAFARSVLHGFKILDSSNGSFLIDFTPFLMRDAHGVTSNLERNKQGSYKLDLDRSALAFERTKAFPKNVEFDVLLTFSGKAKGDLIRSVTPNADLVSVSQHHSLVALPGAGFEMREFDPRCGTYPFSFYDYATPVEQPLVKRFIPRHRLEKKNPGASSSEAVEPIIYYLDNGTPEPIRSALLDGARWWNQAFEAIGYKNAYRVEILPDDADPLDVRYNVIQWVHRSTRGWSYGNSVIDPRTGEIIKGHVSLGSLRIRQDFLIAQALMNKPFANSDDNTQPMLEMALARIRQLSAHEVGHTLGFAHNFAASVNDRASVMDYPHPYLSFKNDQLDISEAYATGIGDWDKVTVAYAYSDFKDGTNKKQALDDILNKAQASGFKYISDSDARPVGGAHATGHLWDNGSNAADELKRVLDVRARAIENFSIDNIRTGEPYSVLEDVFVPLYFFHRYQSEACVKLIGGVDYSYKTKGDFQVSNVPLSKKTQEKALDQLLKTLDAKTLAIPQEKLAFFPPRAIGYPRTRESFKSRTGVTFDPLAAAETASDFVLRMLLNPERANRLIVQEMSQDGNLGFDNMLQLLAKKTLSAKKSKDATLANIEKVVDMVVLKRLMALATDANSYPQVKAAVLSLLKQIRSSPLIKGNDLAGHQYLINLEIDRFLKDPSKFELKGPAPKIPDGSPIGSYCEPLNHGH